MRDFAVASAILGGLVVLVCVLPATGTETSEECPLESSCWYVKPTIIYIITRVRSWRCLWTWKCYEQTVTVEKRDKVCHCCPGWREEASGCKPCDEKTFGNKCEGECVCGEGAQCDPRDGSCYTSNCYDTCINANVWNNTTNACECPKGWTGEKCDSFTGCEDGRYGQSCEHACVCNKTTSTCGGLTGECYCYRGWQGPTCSEQCPPMYHGENCTKACNCPENALACDPVTGDCLCPPGLYGLNCSDECPGYRYGPSCQYPCICNNATETCDRMYGNCTGKGNPEGNADPAPSTWPVGPLAGGIAVGVLLIVGLAVVILFQRRRSKQSQRTSSTIAVRSPEYESTDNPCYEQAKELTDTATMTSNAPLQHSVVGGVIYTLHANTSQTPPDAAAYIVQSSNDYSHVRHTNGDDVNTPQSEQTDDYSHLRRDGERLLNMHSEADISNNMANEVAAPRSAGGDKYDNLERCIKPPGGVKDQYEEVIMSC